MQLQTRFEPSTPKCTSRTLEKQSFSVCRTLLRRQHHISERRAAQKEQLFGVRLVQSGKNGYGCRQTFENLIQQPKYSCTVKILSLRTMCVSAVAL